MIPKLCLCGKPLSKKRARPGRRSYCDACRKNMRLRSRHNCEPEFLKSCMRTREAERKRISTEMEIVLEFAALAEALNKKLEKENGQ